MFMYHDRDIPMVMYQDHETGSYLVGLVNYENRSGRICTIQQLRMTPIDTVYPLSDFDDWHTFLHIKDQIIDILSNEDMILLSNTIEHVYDVFHDMLCVHEYTNIVAAYGMAGVDADRIKRTARRVMMDINLYLMYITSIVGVMDQMDTPQKRLALKTMFELTITMPPFVHVKQGRISLTSLRHAFSHSFVVRNDSEVCMSNIETKRGLKTDRFFMQIVIGSYETTRFVKEMYTIIRILHHQFPTGRHQRQQSLLDSLDFLNIVDI